MGQDHDRQDNSSEPRHKPDSMREEVSATGQRVKGAVERATGAITGDGRLEDKGKSENAEGRNLQRKNHAV